MQDIGSAFAEEFKKLSEDPQPVVLELSKVKAWVIMSQLQLTLRHPENTGATAEIARDLARKIQAKITEDYPTLAVVAEMGWDPQYDVEATQ